MWRSTRPSCSPSGRATAPSSSMSTGRPARGVGPAPLLLYVHGGGWRVSHRSRAPRETRSWERGFFERLTDAGFVVAASDYRLSGEATYPAQLDDVVEAWRWLGSQAEALGIAAGRRYVWGASAGGHLAALLALRAGSAGPRAAVCWYPVTDITRFDPRAEDIYEAHLLGGPIGQHLAVAREASPVTHAHAGAPPILLQHGDADTVGAVRAERAAGRGAAGRRRPGRAGDRARRRPLLRRLRRRRRDLRPRGPVPARGGRAGWSAAEGQLVEVHAAQRGRRSWWAGPAPPTPPRGSSLSPGTRCDRTSVPTPAASATAPTSSGGGVGAGQVVAHGLVVGQAGEPLARGARRRSPRGRARRRPGPGVDDVVARAGVARRTRPSRRACRSGSRTPGTPARAGRGWRSPARRGRPPGRSRPAPCRGAAAAAELPSAAHAEVDVGHVARPGERPISCTRADSVTAMRPSSAMRRLML